MGNTPSHKLDIRFWGVRGSIPCAEPENMLYGGNTSCVQLDLLGCEDYLILDSGSGIRPLGEHLVKTGQQKNGHIFITHAHWDHIQGFPFFKPIYDKANHVSIHMPQQQSGDCKQVLTGQLTPTHFPVTADMLSANIHYITQPPEVQNYGNFSVEFMLANHPVTTAIYKIRTADHVIVYAPDNEITPLEFSKNQSFRDKVIQFCKNADILIHDANYDIEVYRNRRNWGHSTWEDAIDVAKKANVKHVFLTHHDPTANDDQLKDREHLISEHVSHFKTLQLAREGIIYSFTSQDE
jgi:phosphoribosyl 1,2-cyclic phosphodiesterase